ncbi:MAG: hypothetical protein M1834_000326 [Cirrosporium novae-zelandiae]|nr:MAG: hypothetical protein M1834_000326 [Cirrosporium novae-zelandiae]
MAVPTEKPWTEQEKVFLLSEIIRAANIPSGSLKLFQLIQENSVLPLWTEIPLPPGRSLSSCRNAYDEISRIAHPYHETKSFLPMPGPFSRPEAVASSSHTLKRPFSATELSSVPAARALQPRPPIASFESTREAPRVQIPSAEHVSGPPKKKRGRPSNAELEKKRAYYESIGQPYPEPSKRPTKPRKSDPPVVKHRELKPSPAPVATGFTPITVSTPRRSPPREVSVTSSNGKRRGRGTKENHDEKIKFLEEAARSTHRSIPLSSPSPESRKIQFAEPRLTPENTPQQPKLQTEETNIQMKNKTAESSGV